MSVRKASRAVLRTALQRADDASGKLPKLKTELAAFLDDLRVIDAFYSENPDAFRKHRPLTAVHLPAIVSSLEGLAEFGARQLDEARFRKLQEDLKGCLIATRQVRHSLEEDAIRPVEIELAVLKERLPGAELEDSENVGDRSLLGRFAKQASGMMEAATKPVTARLPEVPAISGVYEQIAGRAGGAASAARLCAKGLIEDGVDRISSPVISQILAVQGAIWSGSMSALLWGGIAALVFPPAIPFAAGISFIADGGQTYLKSLDHSAEFVDRAREDRKVARRDEMRKHLAKFTGRSSIVRMETPNVHVQMNLEDDSATGMILSGAFAGESLQDLSAANLRLLAKTAPDSETKDILEAWQRRSQSPA